MKFSVIHLSLTLIKYCIVVAILGSLLVSFLQAFWTKQYFLQQYHDDPFERPMNSSVYFTPMELWTRMELASKGLPYSMNGFKIAMNFKEYNITLDLLDTFSKMMEKHNLTYMMYGGTLIGSLRHNDVIPWDDDIDVIANYSDMNQIWNIFKKMKPNYYIHKPKSRKFWKFYSKHSIKTKNDYGWKWPYLDIWWYTKNENNTINDWSCGWCKETFTPENLFPPVKRKFGPLTLYAPRDPRKFLQEAGYDWTKCVTRNWNHRDEDEVRWKDKEMSCEKLQDIYPFVKHITKLNSSREFRYYRGSLLHII